MLVVNTENAGREYTPIYMVTGAYIMSKNALKDIGSEFRNIIGGKMNAYTQMLNEAKNGAVEEMIREAERLDADAIVNVRFSSSSIVQGGAEILACGTAVKFN